jgi:glycosyltransferase involved in cell wall biosynthesis
VVCQERRPDEYDIGDARVVRPELPDGVLPVFVFDRYEGLDARLLPDLSREQREAYVGANAAVLRELGPADLLFVNHVLLGAPVGVASGLPFRVKAHGSELEYSMRGNDDLVAWGRETLARAERIYVGSQHIREVLEDVLGHVDRVDEVPPGVDIEEFVLETSEQALRNLVAEARADAPSGGDERKPDPDNGERLAEFLADDEPTVVYFGKLIPQKGVQLLLEAVRGLDCRTVIVGFGPQRAELEAAAPPRTLFTGPFEHRHLVHLLPLADVTVVPSIFPEAFGMVAAEAAAAGSPPLVARHSGLAEVAAGIEEEYPEHRRSLVSFERGDVVDLERKLRALLALPVEERAELGRAAREAVVKRWSWASVAERLLEPLG